MKRLFCTFLLCIGFALSPLVANAASCDLSSSSTNTPPSALTDKTYEKVDHCVKKNWVAYTGEHSQVFIAYCHAASGCEPGYILSYIAIADTSIISELSDISHVCSGLTIPNCTRQSVCTLMPSEDGCTEYVDTGQHCGTKVFRGSYYDTRNVKICFYECATCEDDSYQLQNTTYEYALSDCDEFTIKTCVPQPWCPSGYWGDPYIGLDDYYYSFCEKCPENSTTERVGRPMTGGMYDLTQPPYNNELTACKCKENFYGVISAGNELCTACPEHSTSDFNSATIDDCKCNTGYYKSNNRCIKCPALPNGVEGGSDDRITTDGAGKESITDCFIRAGNAESESTWLYDETGYFYFTEDCNYKISAD